MTLKRKIGIILSLCLMVSLIGIPISLADSPETDFTFDVETRTITKYIGAGGDVVIPRMINGFDVKIIGENAFEWHNELTSVSMPDGVVSIADFVFEHCDKLNSVTIPNSVIDIGYGVFFECSSLVSLNIPSSVESIDWIFLGCRNLTEINVAVDNNKFSSLDGVLFNKDKTELITFPPNKNGVYTIPNSVNSISPAAFWDCIGLTSLNILENVNGIDNSIFYRCSNLTAVNIDKNNMCYSSIDGVIFDKYITKIIFCPNKKSGEYVIPSSVIRIDSSAFRNCSNLTEIVIPNSVAYIENWAFEGCSSLTKMILPDNISVINQGMFFGCSSLEDIVLPSSITVIFNNAFSSCSNLKNINIQSNVEAICDYAFSNCRELETIYIPQSVTFIGETAFYECKKLNSINVDIENNAYSSYNGVLFNKDMSTIITYPCGKSGNYEIPKTITCIGDYAFKGCSKLNTLIIPYKVDRIGYSILEDCSSLISVHFEGNAPFCTKNSFGKINNDIKIYYRQGATGFTSPTWNGYSSEMLLPPYYTSSIKQNILTKQGNDITGDISVKITNNTHATKESAAMLAIYSDGRLVKLMKQSVNLNDGRIRLILMQSIYKI